MMLRFALAGAAVLLAGCASVTSGAGSVPTSASTSSSVPQSSAAPSFTTSGLSSPSTSTSDPAESSCVAGNDYCDDFSNAASGWLVENESHYYAHYDQYLDGTYRMGERTAHAKIELAPVDTTTISTNYGVQLDVDATLGRNAPASTYIGLVCWDKAPTSGAQAGFLFFVTADSVDVTLLPDGGGELRTLAANRSGDFVHPYPGTNHLTATCTQRHVGGGTAADLSLNVNGAAVLHEQYAQSVKNYPWSPGSRAGLLVAGKKSDVFYDNFSVTGK